MGKKSFYKKRYYFILTLYFIGFGLLIGMGTSLINVHYRFIHTRKKLTELADTEAEFKREYLQNYISGIEMLLSSIVNNDLTFKYMQSNSRDHQCALQNLFYALAFANKEVMQLRYLDEAGKEVIRIDRDRKSPELIIVPENKLQDKSKRYYFKEASMLRAGQFWHSNVDLNVEHGQIEMPIKPTFRVATQMIYHGEYKGILIANLLFEHTIKSLSNSTGFLVYLADKDGEIIHNPEAEMSWSKYLDHKKTLHDLFPRDAGKILTRDTYHSEKVYSYSLGTIFRNNEDVKLILAPRVKYLKELQHKNIFSALLIALTIIIISLPLSWLASIVPSRLQNKLSETYEKNRKGTEIINKYVIVAGLDLHGNLTTVSTFFSQIAGVKKESILGNPHSLFGCPATAKGTHLELWNTIEKGRIWEGELQDRNEQGEVYWVALVVTPEYNSEHQIESYLAVGQEITNKKQVEQLSITDRLTGLFNRLRLEEVLTGELARFIRYQIPFSVIMLDIDFFKQVNDVHGHPVGDQVLVHLAHILKVNTRETDCVSRWGGEEFLIVASNTNQESAYILAEKLRQVIEAGNFPVVKSVTVSCGVAQYIAGEAVSDLVSRVDKALYRAKNQGRNIVVKSSL